MNILLLHSGKAFLPEQYAYQRHLEARGHDVRILLENDPQVHALTPEVVYRFAGFLRHPVLAGVPEIHEYASASVGRFPRVKNWLKSLASAPAAGRVFLNEAVRSQFHFPGQVPFILRDMGADAAFFAQRGVTAKRYDLVYAGAISTRPGLLDCLIRLANGGFRIGLAGTMTDSELARITACPGIEHVGKLAANEVPAFVSQSRFGLNYCPDIYPYNIQTSTKAIEYLAADIGIVSNRYAWIDAHAERFGYRYLDVDQLRSPDDLVDVPQAVLPEDVARQFEWERLLDDAGFERFIMRCVTHSTGP